MTPLSLVYHDVNEAYSEIQTIKKHYSEWEMTRNGKALVFQAPVLITHTTPYRRVLFDSVRDANPFFHYMEAIWMLAGSNNVNFPAHFASNIRNYSDDGIHLHGAYGYRWRYNWDYDQIDELIILMRRDPNTRRAVLSMWDPSFDLADSKDLPCNTHIYFRKMGDALTMTVCNRSNDLVWGMLGANIVHMSILQEYVAGALDLIVGEMHQFTNNLHVYDGWTDKYKMYESKWYLEHPSYNRWVFSPTTLSLNEAENFVDNMGEEYDWKSRILRGNAAPMLNAWNTYKQGDLNLAVHLASQIYDEDWKKACSQWLKRRLEKLDEQIE